MIKRIQNFFHYKHKAWDLLCNECDQDMYPRHISRRYPRMDSVELYIRTKTIWDFRPLICNRRCVTATNGWLRTFMSDPRKKRHLRKKTLRNDGRYTEPIGPNGTASSLHFRNSADTPTSKFLLSPSCQTTGQYFWTEQIIISFTHSSQLISPSETKRNLLKDSVRTAL